MMLVERKGNLAGRLLRLMRVCDIHDLGMTVGSVARGGGCTFRIFWDRWLSRNINTHAEVTSGDFSFLFHS